MHKYAALTLLLLAFLSSCNNNENNCGEITQFNVVQDGAVLKLEFNPIPTAAHYTISYDFTSNGQDPQNGMQHIFTGSDNVTINLGELNVSANNVYSFHLKAVCTNGDGTDWKGPVTLNIDEYCEPPYSLSVSNFPGGAGPAWDTYDNETEAAYFEVQYGSQGFTLGSGTTVSTNDEYTNDVALTGGTAYDFYVRSYCDNALGWSNWVGPVSHFAEDNQNLCTPPLNVVATIERNFFNDPVGANFTWDKNGESSFECTIVLEGENPDSGQIHAVEPGSSITFLLTQNTDYDFYVRAVCLDGTPTAWIGPKAVNIGS